MDEVLAGPSNTRQSRRATQMASSLLSRPPPLSCSQSPGSPSSPSAPSAQNISISCVTRQTSEEDCSYQRFLAWVAVRRNSSPLISSSEKLQCPLFRCRKSFPDHEHMLKHLAACQHLPTREYWCYEHFRVETFDDMKCRRCIGHPSRRRKMLSMAKTFFSTLGHKSRKGSPDSIPIHEDVMLAPPSYHESQALNLDLPEKPELSSTDSEILEIDSTEVTTIIEPPVPAINPQDLLLPELDSVPLQSSMQWQPTPFMSPISCCDLSAAAPAFESLSAACPAPHLPSQAVQQPHLAPRAPSPSARSKNLSPSSSVRSTTSTVSNISSISTSSSLWSAPSTAWSGLETNFTSASVDLLSPMDVSQGGAIFDGDCTDGCPPPNPLHTISELPADMPPLYELPSDGLGLGLQDPLFAFDAGLTSVDASYPAAFALDEDDHESLAVRPPPPPSFAQLAAPQSEAKSLVAAAWDALQEHIISSQAKIKDMKNPLAVQFGMLSCSTIAHKGLASLRSILDGRPLSSPIDTLSLIHIIYSLSLVVYGTSASGRSSELFAQSLIYSAWFTPTDRTQFRKVAQAIWQPGDMTDQKLSQLIRDQTSHLQRSPSNKGKGPATVGEEKVAKEADPLISVAQNFLDELEMGAILGSSFETRASELRGKHAQAADKSTHAVHVDAVMNILTVLVNRFHDVDGLIAQLSKVNQNITNGLVRSTRRFELEALQAGQNCIVSSRYFDSYAPLVRRLCDPIYDLDSGAGTSQRKDYHALGISFSEALIADLEADPVDDEVVSAIGSDHDALLELLTPPMTDDLMDMDIELQPLLDLAWHDLDVPSTSTGSTVEGLTPTTDKTTATWPDLSRSASSASSKNTMQTQTQTPATSLSASPPQQQQQQQQQQEAQQAQQAQQTKVEANACCETCGYRPKGDPRWFHGSMAKHKRLQHSTEPPKLYKCNFPGCMSQYKNRPDNLRQHQIEKNHFVDGDQGATNPRPSKRKKMA
ncbi:hypothetical protein M406DRAFT_328810 [Cryphonectria parasitica EP155]|uniref:C2H2-type domain-containing protein n=1 Tax=Cryphonectria parasitica (strain ATCC 38755 / EP155) TaxID=660469 RepID=A0A9P5CRY5_CRYP1|nr:uncharacterized protein M406DRAFT_328810 [Cryphonectria parasitica EP155]KAF3767751.1 hypothetical protein M406DRAFT_328810 [Cryphonectria parasitica EP155]